MTWCHWRVRQEEHVQVYCGGGEEKRVRDTVRFVGGECPDVTKVEVHVRGLVFCEVGETRG